MEINKVAQVVDIHRPRPQLYHLGWPADVPELAITAYFIFY